MAPQPLVGREAERSLLKTMLDEAEAASPSTTLVHGQPGIGKTSLLRDTVERARAGGFHVLAGQCLRFGASVTSFLPFSQGIGNWLRNASAGDRERLAGGATAVGELIPALRGAGSGGGTAESGGVALFEVADFLERLAADRPTLLVVDDLQWADPSSLDLVAYLVAGLGLGARQRLAVLTANRDTGLGEGSRLHGWLADMARMPRVHRLDLAPLDLWETEQLVTALDPARLPAVEEIFTRSAGNPYLAELLTMHPDPQGGSAPPSALADALLASWHRLGVEARAVMRLLAVGGRPVAFPVLQQIAVRDGLATESVGPAVAEAQEEGVVVTRPNGDIWFRHPLLAEVVAGTLQRWQLLDLHRRCAEVWEQAAGVTDRERANHLALHYLLAEDHGNAFTWSLVASDLAGRVGATAEEASHLSTAVSLVRDLSADEREDVDLTALLTRAARACERSGDYAAALEHYEHALERVDRAANPLQACRLLLPLPFLKDLVGRASGLGLAERWEAVHLTDEVPHSEERSLALSYLAFSEVFNGRTERATVHVQEAVDLAEELGASSALAWALAVRSQTRWNTVQGAADAESALALARRLQDCELVGRTTTCLCNCYDSSGRYAEAGELTTSTYRWLRDAGAVHDAVGVAEAGVEYDLALGRWDRMRSSLRELLGLRQAQRWSAGARCWAAVLAALQGEGGVARMHLARAKELMPRPAVVGDSWFGCEMLCSIALGDPVRALEVVEQCMAEATAIDPMTADLYLLRAGQAAGDLADLHAVSGPAGSAAEWLGRIERLRGDDPPRFAASGPQDLVRPAFAALYAADRARCLGDRVGEPTLWEEASAATGAAGLRYDRARALFHLGRVLATAKGRRAAAAEALREARDISTDLGAQPLLELVDEVAAQAHLHLGAAATTRRRADEPRQPAHLAVDPPTLDGAHLTPREREVLEHLVLGETYSQIARSLFLSEKTVSVHVSSLLRKTGTTNRVELAALSTRHG